MLIAFAGISAICGCSSKNPVVNSGAPVFVAGSSESRNVAVDSSVVDTILAVDPDGGAVGYSLGEGPSGMTLTGNVLAWTPGIGDSGVKVATIVARDDEGDSSIASFVYFVGDFRFKEVFVAAEEIRKEVEDFRGKAFLRNVSVVVKTRSEYIVERLLSGGLGNELSAAEKAIGNRILVAEGFLRQGDDYWSDADSMFSVGVGGFYRAGTDSLWVIVSDSSAVLSTNTRVSLFHEFVHALQDQYYSLAELEEKVESSDQSYALRYTIEGEAGYLDWYYALKLYDGRYPSSSDRVRWMLRQYEEDIDLALDSLHGLGERLFVYQPFMWAYAHGPEFVGGVVGNMDWTKIDSRLFHRLPVRTREVLEPAVYWAGDRTGFVVTMDSVLGVASRNGVVLDYDEFGSLYTGVLLREWGVSDWKSISLKLVSDRMTAWGDSSGDSISLCWYTHWVDRASLDAFVVAYRSVMGSKYGSKIADLRNEAGEWILDDTVNMCYMESRGSDVYVFEKYRADLREELISAAGNAQVLNWGSLGKIANGTTKSYGYIKKDRGGHKLPVKMPKYR